MRARLGTMRVGSLTLLLWFVVAAACEAGAGDPSGTPGDDVTQAEDSAAAGTLVAAESEIAFEEGAVGASFEESLVLENQGDATVVLSALAFAGDPSFALDLSGGSVAAESAGEVVAIAPPLSVEPGEELTLPLSFLRASPAAAAATLQFFDEDEAERALVTLSAPGDAVYLAATPAVVDFGTVLPGSTKEGQAIVEAFGVEDLAITEISIAPEDGPGVFTVDAQTPAPPLSLPPRTTQAVILGYAPANCTGDGEFVTQSATLQISAEGIAAPVEIQLVGRCPAEPAASFHIAVSEEIPAAPQTTFHLSAAGLAGAARYAWSVTQPAGSRSLFVPSAEVPEPSFTANVAGTYTFALELQDDAGTPLAPPATREIHVVPEAGLHIELLWHTPGDADESDEGPAAGADLDLHFLHPDAPGDASAPDLDGDDAPDLWFDAVLDCFWFNPAPVWSDVAGGLGDPRLDRDDTDGAGPESINLNAPEDGAVYGLAVHAWDDREFGDSLVTLRIYADGVLVEELTDVALAAHDLWDVGTIAWPSLDFVPAQGEDGLPRVISDYEPSLL